MTFDVAPGGRTITNVRVEYNAQCQPPATLTGSYATAPGPYPIAADRSFDASGQSADGTLVVMLKGAFDGAGNVSGTFDVHDAIDYQGTHYECDSGLVEWTGKVQTSSLIVRR